MLILKTGKKKRDEEKEVAEGKERARDRVWITVVGDTRAGGPQC